MLLFKQLKKRKMFILLSKAAIHTTAVIEVLENQKAITHIEEVKCFDYENNRNERCRLQMPELPERQTYVPRLNRKSKRW